MFGRGGIELHLLFKSENVQTQAETPSRPAHQSLSRRGAICPTQKAWNSGASSQTCELGFGRRDIVLAALTVKSKNVQTWHLVEAEMPTRFWLRTLVYFDTDANKVVARSCCGLGFGAS